MSFIQTSIKDGIARLRLTRADKRNALTRELLTELVAFVETVADNDSVRALVLAADGPVFCAGMDLGQMQSRLSASDPDAEFLKDSEIYQESLIRLFELKIPTIASLQGPVLAGGTGIVFACDLVIAAAESFFQLPEPRRGITAAMVCPLLIHRTTVSAASYLLLSGKRITADAALNMGLIQELVVADELESKTEELVQSVLTGSRSAMQITKAHMRAMKDVDVVQQIRESAQVSATARNTPDAAEGLAAFLEKRPPSWQQSN